MSKLIHKKDGSVDTFFVLLLILTFISIVMILYSFVYIWIKGLDSVVADYYKWAITFVGVTLISQITAGTINNVSKNIKNNEVVDNGTSENNT